MLKLEQLIGVTSQSTKRSSTKLRISSFEQKNNDKNEIIFTAFVRGYRGDISRNPVIKLSLDGFAKVHCSCDFFSKILAPPLSKSGALMETISYSRIRDRSKLTKLYSRPSLCPHLLKLALVAMKSFEGMEKTDDPSSKEKIAPKISSKLRGV